MWLVGSLVTKYVEGSLSRWLLLWVVDGDRMSEHDRPEGEEQKLLTTAESATTERNNEKGAKRSYDPLLRILTRGSFRAAGGRRTWPFGEKNDVIFVFFSILEQEKTRLTLTFGKLWYPYIQ